MKTEKIFTGLFVIGLLLKFIHIPGGNVTILITITILSLLYLLFSFYFLSDTTIKNQNTILSVISGIVFFILLIGILFKLLYWPGGIAMMSLAILIGIIHFIIVLITKIKHEKGLIRYYKNLLIRSALMNSFCLLLFIIPPSALINIEYRNDPDFARLKIAQLEDPTNKEIQYELEKYISENEITFL